MLAQSSHGNVHELLAFVSLDDADHELGDFLGCFELEAGVAVRVVEDHFVDVDGYSSHGFYFSLLTALSSGRGEEDRVFRHYGEVVAEVACKEDGAHVALEQDHRRARDVLRIEHPEPDKQPRLHLQHALFLVVVRVYVLDLGEVVGDELVCLGRAMDGPVIP